MSILQKQHGLTIWLISITILSMLGMALFPSSECMAHSSKQPHRMSTLTAPQNHCAMDMPMGHIAQDSEKPLTCSMNIDGTDHQCPCHQPDQFYATPQLKPKFTNSDFAKAFTLLADLTSTSKSTELFTEGVNTGLSPPLFTSTRMHVHNQVFLN